MTDWEIKLIKKIENYTKINQNGQNRNIIHRREPESKASGRKDRNKSAMVRAREKNGRQLIIY